MRVVAAALCSSRALVPLQNKISDSHDSLKDTKADIDKRGAFAARSCAMVGIPLAFLCVALSALRSRCMQSTA